MRWPKSQESLAAELQIGQDAARELGAIEEKARTRLLSSF